MIRLAFYFPSIGKKSGGFSNAWKTAVYVNRYEGV